MPVSNDHFSFPDLVQKGVPKDASLFDFSLYAHNPQMLKSRTNSTDYYCLEQSELHSCCQYKNIFHFYIEFFHTVVPHYYKM